MELYWQEHRVGIRLILKEGDQIVDLGGVRQTPRGFDAFAKTFGYEPGRAEKGIGSLLEARDFVESFTPWDLYGVDPSMEVEQDIRAIET
ncbi:MAG: hypothetical protein CL785_02305 [Chloroflexi bacterium]|nr:hypothetical protein [Chloroflexota bacterium]|tara:strand:- start:16368 stop:16637 length:270 start_codon:yes stop_codon:yes gene_type:complete